MDGSLAEGPIVAEGPNTSVARSGVFPGVSGHTAAALFDGLAEGAVAAA